MIGIIGGYGDVGLQTAKALHEWGAGRLRLGGRNPERAKRSYGEQFLQAEWAEVHIEDDRSMESFMDGCELIINCAGPSYRTSARVAEMCLQHGKHLVDAGFDPAMKAMHTRRTDKAIVYAAGSTPGLSGLLPRWASQSLDRVESLKCYTGTLGKFTASAAEDYLAGAASADNVPLAAWRNGSRRSAAAHRKSRVTLPFFPREVDLYPFLDAEAEFVAASVSLKDGEWYIAVDGTHVPTVLETTRIQFLTDPQNAVARLCAAAELDSTGRRPYVHFLVQLDGIRDGDEATRSVVLRADNPASLTGTVAAAAGAALLVGEIPPGIRPLSEIPDPDSIVQKVKQAHCVQSIQLLNYSIDQMLQTTEGEL